MGFRKKAVLKLATYFVTGASGFIGQHLVRALSRQGHRILALSRRHDQQLYSNPLVEWIKAGVHDVESYRCALKRADSVIHLAGLINARRKEEYIRMNVEGTLTLLKACEETGAPKKRFLHMSSIAAMGPSYDGTLLNESRSCCPETEYGKSKLKAERLVINYSRSIPVVILRPSFVYGNGDKRGLKALTTVIHQPDMTSISFAGTISLCYVSDLIQACMLSLEKDLDSGEIFIISDPHFYTWEDIDKAIQNAVTGLVEVRGSNRDWLRGKSPGISFFETHPKATKRLQHWGCDITQARTRLGFEPKVFLKEGALETIHWYLKEGVLDLSLWKGTNLLPSGR
jgi:nucleoside-diphosphate-sugar epimerase